MATAEKILTTEFFNRFAINYNMPVDEQNIMRFIVDHEPHLVKYVVINYKGLEFMDDIDEDAPLFNADYAFALLGESVKRIFNALVTDYDPLENYFTDRTEQTGKEGSNVKSGDKTTTPAGSVTSSMGGTREKEFTNYGSESAATTFDNPGTVDNPNFSPTSKSRQTGSVKDKFTGYGSTTTYNHYSVTEQYNDITDTQESTENIEEHRSGNSGIFSKQDLTQRELALRQSNLFMKTFVRMLVDAFNKGVW